MMTPLEKTNVRDLRDRLTDIIALAKERRAEVKDTVSDLTDYRLEVVREDLDGIADKLVELFE